MQQPSFIQFAEERFGKPVSQFTKADWERVAIRAAEILDKLPEKALDMLVAVPKRRGRPRKHPRQSDFAKFLNKLSSQQRKKKRGRHPATYGKEKYPIELVSELLSSLQSEEPWKSEPQIEIVRDILRHIDHGAGNADSVMSAVRRFRSGQKSLKKSR